MTLEETNHEVFELVTVAEEAQICVEQSMHVLCAFEDRWFSDAVPSDMTMLDIRSRYRLLQSILWLIVNGLGSAEEQLSKLIEEGMKICKSLK